MDFIYPHHCQNLSILWCQYRLTILQIHTTTLISLQATRLFIPTLYYGIQSMIGIFAGLNNTRLFWFTCDKWMVITNKACLTNSKIYGKQIIIYLYPTVLLDYSFCGTECPIGNTWPACKVFRSVIVSPRIKPIKIEYSIEKYNWTDIQKLCIMEGAGFVGRLSPSTLYPSILIKAWTQIWTQRFVRK